MIRRAKLFEFDQINIIREEVSKLHAENENQIFKKDFSFEIRNLLYKYFENEYLVCFVNVKDNQVVGFCLLELMVKPESPYRYGNQYIHISEFGIKEEYRHHGYGRELMEYIKDIANKKHLQIELDVWSFNENAKKFYKSLGFETYRELMRTK